MNNTKVFIVGLDGATFEVLRPLVSQGCMPTLGKLMAEGVVTELESTIPPVTPPAWTSFMTGKHPAKHGIFDFKSYNPATDRETLVNASNIRAKTLWQLLSEKGKRVGVLNLPLTFPPYPINGFMVSGFDIPSRESSFTYPADLREEILRLVPDYTFTAIIWGCLPVISGREIKEFTDTVIRVFEQTTILALYLLKKYDWDVFMVHYQDVDVLQHYLWHHIEKACSDRDARGSADLLRNCYRKLDQCLTRLMNQVDQEQVTRFFLSDHGFGRFEGIIYPNVLLREWGYLSVTSKRTGLVQWVKQWCRKSDSSLIYGTYRFIAGLKSRLQRQLRLKQSTEWTQEQMPWEGEAHPDHTFSDRRGIDLTRTKVTMVMGSQGGLCYVNLKGRNHQGIVEPSEYEALLYEIKVRFETATHPSTGAKLFQAVRIGQGIYQGSNGFDTPDLILIPAEGYSLSSKIDENVVGTTPSQGNHRQKGILIAQGPNIQPTSRPVDARIVDLAPTILHILGLPVPSDMDGRVLREIITADHAVVYEDPEGFTPEAHDGLSTEESAIIEERLKGLGYLS